MSALLLAGCGSSGTPAQSAGDAQGDQQPQQEADGTKVLEYTWVRSRPSAKNFIPLNPIDEFPTTKKSLRVWIDDNDRVVKHEYSGVFYVYRKPLIGSNSTHSMRPLTQEELDGLADPTEEAAADKE